jgi:hypothetical protein
VGEENQPKPRGYRAAERDLERAHERVWELQREIFKTQAHTFAGLNAKAGAIELDGNKSAFLRALAQDILAMTIA